MSQDHEPTDAEQGEPDSILAEDRSEPETGPHLVLDLEGDRQVFEAVGQRANQFLMVKYIDDISVPGYPSTRAITKLALGQVKDVGRLEAYLEQHGFADGYAQHLYDALSACWEGETMLPLVRS